MFENKLMTAEMEKKLKAMGHKRRVETVNIIQEFLLDTGHNLTELQVKFLQKTGIEILALGREWGLEISRIAIDAWLIDKAEERNNQPTK